MSAAASQMNGGSALIAMTTVSFVDGGIRDGNAGNPLGRGNRFGQRVSVVRLAFAHVDAHDPVAAIGRRY